MEGEFDIALKALLELAQEPAIGIEPCHLIFVLIGHQLVGIAGDSFGQLGEIGTELGLGFLYPFGQSLVAFGIGGILIGGEFFDPARDDLVRGG